MGSDKTCGPKRPNSIPPPHEAGAHSVPSESRLESVQNEKKCCLSV